MSDYKADLDGNCERCGLAIGFSGVHTVDDCVDDLKAALKRLEEERERPVHLVLSTGPQGSSIAVSAFGTEEDAVAEMRRLEMFSVRPSVRSVTVARRPTELHQAPAHGPDKR